MTSEHSGLTPDLPPIVEIPDLPLSGEGHGEQGDPAAGSGRGSGHGGAHGSGYGSGAHQGADGRHGRAGEGSGG
ncbi:hypothetical protein GCM10010218_07640 [Streptomyces mashuensis]|uniref:Uncharacterized protein n=1 Tax=Streptomyces mashuensis TaxID=33904 RepID=A0A919EAM5_9ACTN|nr:hypothetical protein GCM10010218_07640 [Streptomyces mashuensis]